MEEMTIKCPNCDFKFTIVASGKIKYLKPVIPKGEDLTDEELTKITFASDENEL